MMAAEGKMGSNHGQPRLAVRDPEQVERDVEEIGQLDLAGLRSRWRKTFGRDAPPGLYREFMARALAYRIQADAFGDLDRATKQLLAQVAQGDESALDADRPLLKPGTMLVREWHGTLHRVTVLDRGFAWRGKTFASLSAAARAITGTNWNGHVFFGLRPRKVLKENAAARN